MAERKKRKVAAVSMDPVKLADHIERGFTTAYEKIVERGESQEATQALVELLRTAALAIDKAEEAAEAAKAVRVAVIRCQVAVGMTMEDIGAVHGLTRQRIGQLLRSSPAS